MKTKALLIASACWCGVLGFSDFYDEWPYQLSRWALCASCFYAGFGFWKSGMREGLIPLGAVAIAFNPVAPIAFDEEEWIVADWIAAAIFIGYIPGLLTNINSAAKTSVAATKAGFQLLVALTTIFLYFLIPVSIVTAIIAGISFYQKRQYEKREASGPARVPQSWIPRGVEYTPKTYGIGGTADDLNDPIYRKKMTDAETDR